MALEIQNNVLARTMLFSHNNAAHARMRHPASGAITFSLGMTQIMCRCNFD
jgi:hypothetical protein